MKPRAMFLRSECLLPDGLDLVQKRFCTTWMSVEETTSAVLDEKVRKAGWHFMWLHGASSSSGVGRTVASAIDKGVTGALKRIQGRFNAAELESIKISKYPGFRVARITLHVRHIQQETSLSLVDEISLRRLAAR